MDYVLKTNALSKSYKAFKALNGLSMNVPKGQLWFGWEKWGWQNNTYSTYLRFTRAYTGNYMLYGKRNTKKEGHADEYCSFFTSTLHAGYESD